MACLVVQTCSTVWHALVSSCSWLCSGMYPYWSSYLWIWDWEDLCPWIDTNMDSGSEPAFTFLPGMKKCLFVLFVLPDTVEILWHFYDRKNTEIMLLIWMIVSTIQWTSVFLVFNRWTNRCGRTKSFAQNYMTGERTCLLVRSWMHIHDCHMD